MNLRKSLLRWSVALLAVVMLAACGSSTSTTSATGGTSVQKAQTGQVTFNVQFPQAALKKALMDNRTVSIYVEWGNLTTQTFIGSTTLTPNASGLASATVDVPVGNVAFKAVAKDSNNIDIETARSAGTITTGSNLVYLTFLSGDWQFVDASDNLLPQTFGTTTLAGFSLNPFQNTGPAKATIDPTKPREWSEYQLQWQSSTAAIGPLMWAGQEAQFNAPTVTGSSFNSDWLNITDPARSDSINGSGSNYLAGDRLVWILNWKDGDGPTSITNDATGGDLIPSFRTAGDSQVLDGNHLGGHLMAMTFESLTQSAATGTNVDCSLFYYQQATTPAAARASAIKASLAKPAGKAAVGDETVLAASTATVKYADCIENYAVAMIDGDGDGDNRYEQLTYDANGNWRYDAGDTYIDGDSDGHWDYTYFPGTTYDMTEVYSNVIAREFRAKGSQRGSVYTAPTPVGSYTGNSYLTGVPTPIANINFSVDNTGALTGTFIDLTDNNQRYNLATQVNQADGTLSATFNLITSGDLITITGTATSGTWTRTGTTFMTGTYSTSKIVPSITASAVGTFMRIDPVSNDVAVVSIVDSSKYIMGENGVADPPYGGPGIEVGTYSIDSTSAIATFNVTYETNGDWGPATVGTPSAIQIADLSATGLTLFDPKDGLFTLTRVMSDPGNAVVGSWHFTTAGSDGTVLVLLNNGQYYAVQADEVDTNNRFFESGTYTWNSATGAFSGTGVTSTNPSNSAIAAPGFTDNMTITVSGNTLTLNYQSTIYTATRL